eukprot:4985719-Pyramimonas_sp.AAC.1
MLIERQQPEVTRVDAVPRLCRGVAELAQGPLEHAGGGLGEPEGSLRISRDLRALDLTRLPDLR